MKTNRFKLTTLACLASVVVFFSCSSCAVKSHFLTSKVVPAAQGIVQISTDKNNNYVIKLEISNLSPSSRLTPPSLAYIVWMVGEDNSAKSLGQLNTSDNFMSNNLNSTFEAISASKPVKIVITAENDLNVQYPLIINKNVMKKIILSLSLVLLSTLAFSQSALYRGSNQLNLGVGLSDSGIPIYIGLDHSILTDLTLGGELSYRAFNENWQNNYYNHNIIGISGNLNYHFNTLFGISPRWDLYAGANVGFYVWTSPDGYTGNHSSNLGLGAQVGGRYYFSNSFGINIEFGGGNAFTGGKLGLSFRL